MIETESTFLCHIIFISYSASASWTSGHPVVLLCLLHRAKYESTMLEFTCNYWSWYTHILVYNYSDLVTKHSWQGHITQKNLIYGLKLNLMSLMTLMYCNSQPLMKMSLLLIFIFIYLTFIYTGSPMETWSLISKRDLFWTDIQTTISYRQIEQTACRDLWKATVYAW